MAGQSIIGTGDANPAETSPLLRQPTIQNSLGPTSRTHALCRGFIGLLIVGILLITLNAASIGAIIVGSLHLEDCRIEPHIPALLISLGFVAFLVSTLDVIGYLKKNDPDSCLKKTSSTVGFILKVAHLILFIYTCVIVYRSYSHVVYDESPVKDDYSSITITSNYCNRLVYLYAFWYLTIVFILAGIFFTLVCCLFCCAAALTD